MFYYSYEITRATNEASIKLFCENMKSILWNMKPNLKLSIRANLFCFD